MTGFGKDCGAGEWINSAGGANCKPKSGKILCKVHSKISQLGAILSRTGKKYATQLLYGLFLIDLLYKAYSFDPFNGLTSAQQKLVLGGEQLLWTEQSGPENLDSIVWPRAAVAAEVFWTGATISGGAARNVKEALPRLHDVR